MKIYSNIEKEKLLHQINRTDGINDRQNLCHSDAFLQCAIHKRNKGLVTAPHMHLEREILHKHYVTQEAWVVIEGSILALFFDIDDTFLCNSILHKGDICITFYGGHTFEVLENNTIIYEFKSGPHIPGLDKKLIENENTLFN